MRYNVRRLIQQLEEVLGMTRSPQTWSQWRAVCRIAGKHYCTYDEAILLTAAAFMRQMQPQAPLNPEDRQSYGAVLGFFFAHQQLIAETLQAFHRQEEAAYRLPPSQHPRYGRELVDEMWRHRRVVKERTLRDWVNELDRQGKLTIDIRPGAPKFENRLFTPEDIDALVEWARQMEIARKQRGRKLGQQAARRKVQQMQMQKQKQPA
jgi:hypothetical protein